MVRLYQSEIDDVEAVRALPMSGVDALSYQ